MVSKKKLKKTNVPFSEMVYDALSAADLDKAKEDEYKMAFQDRVMEETKDKKNAVEAYVYDMRNKVDAMIFVEYCPTTSYVVYFTLITVTCKK